VSQIHNRHFCVVWCREKRFSLDFRVQQNHEGLCRKTNGRTCSLNLGPRILKIVVFGARRSRRLLHLHPHSGLGSYEIQKKMEDFAKKQTAEHVRLTLNLGPWILKIVVFGARRRLLHPHFGLWSSKAKAKEKRFFRHQTTQKCWLWIWATDYLVLSHFSLRMCELFTFTGIQHIINNSNLDSRDKASKCPSVLQSWYRTSASAIII
jgi:hypothetical protein